MVKSDEQRTFQIAEARRKYAELQPYTGLRVVATKSLFGKVGVKLGPVEPGSPGYLGGLQEGDVVIAINANLVYRSSLPLILGSV